MNRVEREEAPDRDDPSNTFSTPGEDHSNRDSKREEEKPKPLCYFNLCGIEAFTDEKD